MKRDASPLREFKIARAKHGDTGKIISVMNSYMYRWREPLIRL